MSDCALAIPYALHEFGTCVAHDTGQCDSHEQARDIGSVFHFRLPGLVGGRFDRGGVHLICGEHDWHRRRCIRRTTATELLGVLKSGASLAGLLQRHQFPGMAPAAPPGRIRALQTLLVVCALATIATAGTVHWGSVSTIARPLATASALLIALISGHPSSSLYRRIVLLGTLFAVASDVIAVLPKEYFVAFLSCCSIAHLLYLLAFAREGGWAERKVAFVAYALVATPLLAAVVPTLPPDFKIPVTIYVAVTSLMAAQGASWMLARNTLASRRAAIGGAWFVVSSYTFIIDRFRNAVPFSEALVLATYWCALWYVARSVSGSNEV